LSSIVSHPSEVIHKGGIVPYEFGDRHLFSQASYGKFVLIRNALNQKKKNATHVHVHEHVNVDAYAHGQTEGVETERATSIKWIHGH